MVCLLVTMVELEAAKSQKLFSICPIFDSKGWDILRKYFQLFFKFFIQIIIPCLFNICRVKKSSGTVIRFGFLGWYQIWNMYLRRFFTWNKTSWWFSSKYKNFQSQVSLFYFTGHKVGAFMVCLVILVEKIKGDLISTVIVISSGIIQRRFI